MSPSWFPKWGKADDKNVKTGPDRGDVEAAGTPPGDRTELAAHREDAITSPENSAGQTLSMPLDEDQIMEALKEVYDPELAINIVDLGLVYEAIPDGKTVTVKMTLTSPGCPVGPMLQALVDGTVRRTFPQVEDVKVDLVWNPPWDPYTMASEEAKDMLGIW